MKQPPAQFAQAAAGGPPPAPPQKEAKEEQEAQERSAPSGKVIYKAIVAEGAEELERPSAALFWSGLAAGLSMSFSMIAEGLLMHYLPNATWQPLVASLGYSLGFLIVILGRQQLFTENTLTPILPLLQEPTWACLRNVGRLWGIVLFANLLGGVMVAFAIAYLPAFEPEVKAEFARIGHTALSHDFWTTLVRGVFAGWMIALMVWLLPFAEQGRLWVIIFVTYIVGVAHFSHVIAGSVEVFTLAAMGQASWGEALGGFVAPALLGNIIGGLALVAALNHAQITAGEEED
ncbi:formate/nitrite transporter family protein [Hymenobacter nivis]|uniref:Formate/nitrite transporter family protein n=1 Tax=Hymenobacter nivis TaxID=1850093 RepID=A0A502H233_9BACT|nr:formate/nitrite transporter family protein [Hymenobacter nivis]TPG67373.1 formate/nitrite transporter family protein [Hymenobacter nivis]